MRVLGFLGLVLALWIVLTLYQKSYSSHMGEDGVRHKAVTEDVRDRVNSAHDLGQERLARQLGSD